MSDVQKLDELDREIIGLLSKDARISNRKIASKLGYTEGTIRSRIKRLEEENAIQFTAVTNMAHMQRPLLAQIGIHAEQNQIRVIADKVAAMKDINAVILMLGRYDILAIGLFDGLPAVQQIASNAILDIPGVRHIETTLVVDVTKYNSLAAKIIKS